MRGLPIPFYKMYDPDPAKASYAYILHSRFLMLLLSVTVPRFYGAPVLVSSEGAMVNGEWVA